jgi:hypothetical protein
MRGTAVLAGTQTHRTQKFRVTYFYLTVPLTCLAVPLLKSWKLAP